MLLAGPAKFAAVRIDDTGWHRLSQRRAERNLAEMAQLVWVADHVDRADPIAGDLEGDGLDAVDRVDDR